MKIKFLPQNLVVTSDPGKSVRDIAREQKLFISSSCNGMCTCAECKVYVVEGENHILPPTEKEVELIGRGYVIDRRRLSCQLFCFGDITVDLSGQVERAKNKNVNRQMLKKLKKTRPEEVASVGGVLIEKDQDMKTASELLTHQVSHEKNFNRPLKPEDVMGYPSRKPKPFNTRRAYSSSKGPGNRFFTKKQHSRSPTGERRKNFKSFKKNNFKKHSSSENR